MDPNAPKPDPNETRGPEVLAAVITFPALGLLMVMLRLYTRFRIIHNPSWDDLCIVIGVVCLKIALSELNVLNPNPINR